MALNNIRREPRREITEQIAGLLFILAYAGWIAFSVRLSILWTDPVYCVQVNAAGQCTQSEFSFWKYPGPFFLTLILSLSVWLLYPFLLLMHAFGEMVCGWMTAFGFDPRPTQRY